LYPPGELTLENVTDAVLNVARYDVFQLPIAMLAGDAAAHRQDHGRSRRPRARRFRWCLWVITEELRTLLRVKAQVDAGRPFSAAARENRLWGPREKLAERALARLSVDALSQALQRAADIDRLAKGLRAPAADSNAWLELTELALAVARR
jgi:DNA polymerase III subunit delta